MTIEFCTQNQKETNGQNHAYKRINEEMKHLILNMKTYFKHKTSF
jgi:hypothetical protein